jgi:hypothetical protein
MVVYIPVSLLLKLHLFSGSRGASAGSLAFTSLHGGVLAAVRDGARQQKEDGRGLLSGRYPPRRLQLVGALGVRAAFVWQLSPIFLLQKDKTLPDF